jgi:hypothetical protein
MKKSNDMDDFEQQLQQRPMRSLPAEWRGDILCAAKAASDTQPAPYCPLSGHAKRNTPSFLSTITPQFVAMKLWQELIWPCRRVWFGMAAIWFVVLAINLATNESPKVANSQMPPATPEVMAALREQKQLLVQLLEPVAPSSTPPAAAPRPRSEKRETVLLG